MTKEDFQEIEKEDVYIKNILDVHQVETWLKEQK